MSPSDRMRSMAWDPAAPEEQLGAPFHFPPGDLLGRGLPLVIYLHSDGGNEAELAVVMPYFDEGRFVGLALRAPQAAAPADLAFSWGNYADAVETIADRTCRLLDGIVADYGIDRERVFLIGCGTAGELALHAALLHPRRFAGVVSLVGRFSEAAQPLAARGGRQCPPLLIINALKSQRFPEADLADFVKFAHAAGLSATLRLYPGEETVTTSMLQDTRIWMEAILRRRESTAERDIDREVFTAAPVEGEAVIAVV